jgi:hypothetical protein
MTTDTSTLLLLAAGLLAGVSATLLAIRVPDAVATAHHIAAELRNRAARSSRQPVRPPS